MKRLGLAIVLALGSVHAHAQWLGPARNALRESKPIIDMINQWFVQMVSSEETKKFLNNFGGDPYSNTPEQGQALLERDVKDWGDYVRLAKIEPM